MYEFSKIKLVIWDLDSTLWDGTLSEGAVSIPPAHRQLVQRLTDVGIMNSICSKNDLNPVQKRLEEEGLWEQFVFPSVNWEAKGDRIRQLIADMQLRPVNVLFVDDNPSNLEEARFFSPGLMTALPEVLPTLLEEALSCTKTDPTHSRLQQYKVLEEKQVRKQDYASNEEFLYHSNIRVAFGTDCLQQLDRIHDLVWRSNQLNFTKVRATREALTALFAQPEVTCGYVSVQDNFGDYGIVGFYALEGDRLLHFCFSCRTLGMGIEQYVYGILHRPRLEIVGEVISSLEGEALPGWINQRCSTDTAPAAQGSKVGAHTVLIKGPCDLFQILPYIADKSAVDTELTYVTPTGLTIEATAHTTHMVEALRLTQAEKDRLLGEVPFSDPGIYSDRFATGGYKLVIVSILQDANLGVYQRKGTGERIAFMEGYRPITDPANWDLFLSGNCNTSGYTFTQESLQQFAAQYEFVGINTPEQIAQNLREIRRHLPSECALAVMLGGELYYEKNTFPAYENRHLVHREINAALRTLAQTEDIRLLDVNQYLVDQSSFYDHFNHYIKPVYYALAGDIVALMNEQAGLHVKKSSRLVMLRVRLKEFLAPYYYKLRGLR